MRIVSLVKVENGFVVAMYEPKMFKFGDYVHVKKAIFPKCGIVLRSYIDDFGFLVYDVLDTNGDKLISAHVESAYEDEIMRINEYISKEKIELDFDKQVVVKKRWIAEKLEDYFIINGLSDIERVTQTDDEFDFDYYSSGNYFRTKEQAEKVAKEIREIFEKHKND
jgi:hypothetical protein